MLPFGVGKIAVGAKAAGAVGATGATSKLANASRSLKTDVVVVNGVTRIGQYEVKFIRNPKHDMAEFGRQIAGQEAGLNGMTVAQFLNNRDATISRVASGGSVRAIEGNAAQQLARERALGEKIEELVIGKGLPLSEAQAQARQWMNSQAALHNPDQIAGGFANRVDGLGDKGINSSIGSQWRTRIGGLDQHVREIAGKMSKTERESTFVYVKISR